MRILCCGSLRFLSKGKSYGAVRFGYKKNIKKPHRTVTKCTPVFKNRTVRCDADSSLEHPAVRFGAILLKAKPHRTAPQRKKNHTVKSPEKIISCLRRIGWLRLLAVLLSYTKPIPTHEKLPSCGKTVAQMPLLTKYFLGLGWPWVGEFVGFIMIFACFPTPT